MEEEEEEVRELPRERVVVVAREMRSEGLDLDGGGVREYLTDSWRDKPSKVSKL